jgi:hypothetical protein
MTTNPIIFIDFVVYEIIITVRNVTHEAMNALKQRIRGKMKDDAIAQLSDQVVALTARMQELERKQLV